MVGPRWRREEELVSAAYPSAKSDSTEPAGRRSKSWTVPVSPVTSPSRLPHVLADLDANLLVEILMNGEVGHAAECDRPDHQLERYGIRIPQQIYVVELEYPAHEHGAGGPMHPRARVVKPPITARTMEKHPHMYATPEGSDSWACPVAPHDAGWSWREGGTVAYLDQVSIWILKSLVWWRTGGGIPGFGRWLGSEATHDPRILLATDREAPCPCGSGKWYATCHRPDHARQVLGATSCLPNARATGLRYGPR